MQSVNDRPHTFRGHARWSSCVYCNMPELASIHVKTITITADEITQREESAQQFRMDRPDLFEYRVMQYLTRYVSDPRKMIAKLTA